MRLNDAPEHVRARALQLYAQGRLAGLVSCEDFFANGVLDEAKDEIGITIKAVYLSWPVKAWYVENRSGDLLASDGWVSPSFLKDARSFDTEEEAREMCGRLPPLLTRPVQL